ncbi:C-type lectin protein [Crassisporium funariophilum]|nr:C-type lectin protein [Crassisporium funariophilum]
MLSQRLSPSSSGSSRSGSPDTRATTPSSISDISCASYLFNTYAYLPSASLTPSTLTAIFNQHSSGSCMGFIIDRKSANCRNGSGILSFNSNAKWTAHSLTHRFGFAVNYFISTTCISPDSQVISSSAIITTDPKHATLFNIFSLASLRSVLSVPLKGLGTLHVLEKPTFVYPPLSSTISQSFAASQDGSSGNIPTLADWKTLWATWDLITLQMIPEAMLHQKPIDLRHKCLFYIGHIPTFLDMLIHKSIGGGPSEPKYFWDIFERGIDPHVDDPDHCHNHSEVPDNDEDWPTLDTIIAFRDRVRLRLTHLYEELATGKRTLTRNIARTLAMTHEHEGFHIETLLYMLIQKAGAGTLPPPGFLVPPWEDLTQQWCATPPPSTNMVVVGPATVTLGHDDSEAHDKLPERAEDVRGHTFGWDNESPARQVFVDAFRAEWRPVTNAEFQTYWSGDGKGVVDMPKSWAEEDGEVKVRTMYGLVPMQVAALWPVLTSYDDLAIYARSKGGRLPTESELRLFLDLYDVGHEGGANIGFRNWHPVPATTGLDDYRGKGSNGGVWEWTSTVFDTHEGLVPTQLFTGYSTDFFDTKHQVALGASYATIPRLAGRRTVRNFYQHNYPYPWIGARVVYDV